MRDSSEGSAHPNAVSSMSMLGESQGAPIDLDNTQEPNLGDVIRQRIVDAEKENTLRGQRGHSWALDGRQPALVWQSRTKWLTAAAAELACAPGRQLCRKWGVSSRTVLLVARACAHFADSSTGRGVTASNATIGRVAAELAGRARPYCHDVVLKARAVLAALELAVEVAVRPARHVDVHRGDGAARGGPALGPADLHRRKARRRLRRHPRPGPRRPAGPAAGRQSR